MHYIRDTVTGTLARSRYPLWEIQYSRSALEALYLTNPNNFRVRPSLKCSIHRKYRRPPRRFKCRDSFFSFIISFSFIFYLFKTFLFKLKYVQVKYKFMFTRDPSSDYRDAILYLIK